MNNKDENQDSTMTRASFGVLLGQLINTSVAVIRDEIALVIQRVSEKVKDARRALVLLALGAFVSLAALLCLCAALIIALTAFMAPMPAALVVGMTLALCGAIFIFIGYRLIKT